MFVDVKEVFDLFDFWDGRDGLVDAAKMGEVMRCCGLTPTNKLIMDNGGTQKIGKEIIVMCIVYGNNYGKPPAFTIRVNTSTFNAPIQLHS